MYHPPSKRVQFWRRFASYSAMILAILSLVTVLVFVVLGYQFDKKDGRIEQGGLVQFASQPGGADISIDGIRFGAQTSTKTTMTAGAHYIMMTKPGYQTWSKSISLLPGSILWLTYARLIPQDLSVAKVADFPSVSSSVASPDQKWIILSTDPSQPDFQLTDISQQTPVTTKLSLPSTAFTAPPAGKTQQFTVMEWDGGSRYVLIKHTVEGAAPEWIVLDTQSPAHSQDITTQFGMPIDAIHFSPASAQAFYALTNGDVRKIDMSAGTISRPLVSNVEEFRLYKDTGIIFTTKLDPTTKSRSVGYVLDGDTAPHILQTVNDDGSLPYRLAIGDYFSTTYVSISYGTTLTVRSGNMPKTSDDLKEMQLVTTQQLSEAPTQLSSITGNRFVVAETPNTFAVYDLELHKMSETPYKGDGTGVTHDLSWIDGYMPWSDRDGTLRLYEFDGTNQHDIMPVALNQAVTLTSNGTYLYAISPASGGHQSIERVKLIL